MAVPSRRPRSRAKRPETRPRNPYAPWLSFAEAADQALLIVAGQRIAAASSRAARLFGANGASSLTGRSIATLVAREERPRFAKLWSVGARGSGAHVFETLCVTPDARRIPAEIEATAATLGKARVRLTVVRDITRRKEEEADLRASENLLRQVFDAVPERLFVKDREGRYLRVNLAQAQATGIAAEKFVGMTTEQVALRMGTVRMVGDIHAEDSQVIRTGEKLVLPDMLRAMAGGRRWSRVIKGPLRDEQGEPVGVIGLGVDVTEQHEAEEALRSNRQLLEAVLDHIPLGIVAKDLAGRHVIVNRATADLHLAQPDDIIGTLAHEISGLDRIPDRERDTILSTDEEAKRGRVVQFEMERTLASGKRAFRVTKVPIFDAQKRVQMLLAMAEDVTETKRHQEDLQRSQTLLSSILNTLPHLVYAKDADGRFLMVNPYFEEFYGVRVQDLLNRPTASVQEMEPAARDAFVEQDRKILSGEVPMLVADVEYRHPTKGLLYLRIHKAAMFDSKRHITGLVGVTQDVTGEQSALIALRNSEQVLRDAIESFPGGFSLWDPSGRLVLCNAGLKEVWPEIAAELVPGAFVTDLVRLGVERMTSRRGGDAEARVTEVLADFGRTVPFEYQIGERWLRAVRNRISSGGTIGVITDITESKRREEELRQAQRLEAIGQLTGGIAHDFNNLLTVIQGGSEALLFEHASDPRAATPLRMISEAAQRGAALTQRLLAYARRQVLQPAELDLNKVVSGVEPLLRRALGEHIHIEVVAGGGLWKTLADPSQVENALLNLAVNARDAMPDGGRLTIETANARLDDEYAAAHGEVRPGQYVLLSVTDTGVGMPPEVLARAFDPFFTTKEVGKGTGLGLSMVYGFVKQSGGHVKIYSERGQGTAVKIYLPRATGFAPVADSRPPTGDALPTGTETILVVEDDELVRANAIAQLESLGYRVLAASDSQSALAALRQAGRVDLLFSDVVIPGGMNGRQLADEARRLQPELRVLFCSGYSANAIVHQGRLDPGIQLLPKPYRKVELAFKVRQVMDGPG